MGVVRFYSLFTKKVRRVKFSTHSKKSFFFWCTIWAGCVCQPSHFRFPCHFALPFSLEIFFSDFEGPWSSASTKTEIFVSSPLFPVCLSFSSFPPPPFSPSLHLLSARRAELRSGSEKKIENFLTNFNIFYNFLK